MRHNKTQKVESTETHRENQPENLTDYALTRDKSIRERSPSQRYNKVDHVSFPNLCDDLNDDEPKS